MVPASLDSPMRTFCPSQLQLDARDDGRIVVPKFGMQAPPVEVMSGYQSAHPQQGYPTMYR